MTEATTRLRHGDIVEAVADVEADARAGHKAVFVACRAFRPIQKVLVANDGGGSALKAVDHIARSPLFQGLTVHVVTVGSVTPEVTNGLADAKAMLKAARIEAETSVLPVQPETALANLVEEAQIDMLVMGACGHSRIRSLIIGSTTTAMIRACKVPVVLMR